MAGKLFVTGDLHGEIDGRIISSKKWPEGKTLDRDDVLLVCGDFGFWWDESRNDYYWRDWLESKPFTIAFCEGNHDNQPLLERNPTVEKWGADVKQLRDNIFWLRRGRVYDINGVSVFAFGGATSSDKEKRNAYVTWWPEEVPTYGEWMIGETNLDVRNWQVDIVISHTLPTCMKDEAFKLIQEERGFMQPIEDPTEAMLQAYYEKTHFLAWFAGHFHTNALLSDGKTRVVYQRVLDVKHLLMRD